MGLTCRVGGWPRKPGSGPTWLSSTSASDQFDEWRGKTEYGGSVSVRYPVDWKPLVVHGQDESIDSSEAAPK